MLDYDVIGGIPVRVLKPERFFDCHAFSEDGALFAAGDRSSCIKVWRRSDYALVGIFRGAYAFAMAFVDGGSSVLRILYNERRHYLMLDLKIGQPEEGRSTTSKGTPGKANFIAKRVPFSSLLRFRNGNFSDDGTVLSIAFSTKIFRICFSREEKLNQGGPPKLEKVMTASPIENNIDYSFAMLSPNGKSIWALCTERNDIPDEGTKDAFIAVWPRSLLHPDAASEPVVIKGNRAVWMAGGEYLAVWDDEYGRPRLSVYKTEDLSLDNVEAISTKILRSGLSRWQAVEKKQPRCTLLLREVSKSGKERCTEWNFEEDAVKNEVFFNRRREEEIDDYMQTNRESDADLFSSCAEDEKHWIGSISPEGLFEIASHHTGARVLSALLPKEKMSLRERSVKFDRPGQHFIIIGGEAIYAFAPAFFQRHASCHCSTMPFPKGAIRDDSDGIARETYLQLGSRVLASACYLSTSWRKFWADPTLSDVNRIAVSPDGDYCALVRERSDEGLFGPGRPSRGGKYKACFVKLGRSKDMFVTHKAFPEVMHYADHPQALFVFRGNDGLDRIIIMDMYASPKLLAFEVGDQRAISEEIPVPVNIDRCLHVHQTWDKKRLVMLESRAVTIFDLNTMAVKERISYQTDFIEVAKLFVRVLDVADTSSCHHAWAEKADCRMIADDGKTVLLGWDANAQKSIFVTPETEQIECEEAIIAAGDRFSRLCRLSNDGAGTLFMDIDELSKGRIVIGIYSNRGEIGNLVGVWTRVLDLKMRSRICVTEEVPNVGTGSAEDFHKSSVFYEMVNDASEILVHTVPNEDLEGLVIQYKNEHKRYTIYGTEECIPDYKRFISAGSGTKEEKVQKFRSDSVFNHPVSEGMSIFQEAYQEGDDETVKGIMKVARDEGFELDSRCLGKDLLAKSIVNRDIRQAEKAITMITSSSCSINDQVSTTTEDVSRGLQLAPYRVTKALQEDEFVTELCQIEVHTDFLDPLMRRDQAVHVETVDDVLDWKFDDDMEELAQRWREKYPEVVKEMETGDSQSMATASLKIVCIDGAARPGPLGLVRHLLLHGVPEDVFKSRAVKWIVSWKWFKIWKPKFIRQFLWHVAFLACLTAYIIVLAMSSDLVGAKPWIRISTSVLAFVLVVYGVLMAMGEKRELMSLVNEGRDGNQSKWKGVRYYFSSKWNWIDTALCVMLLVLMPLFHVMSLFLTQCNPVLSAVVAVVALLSYIKVWYYAQPFRVTGALVLMIENIIRDCLPFLTLVSIMLIGFVLAIHVMMRSVINKRDGDTIDEDVNDAFGSFFKSTLTLFYALFASFDSEVYAVNHELKFLGIITFGIYMIAQIIVLLNLLIAIMGDTFDRVKSNEEGQMLMARAMIIDPCEASATKSEMKEIEKLTGRYIYAVENINNDAEDTAPGWWTGKFNMMIEKLKAIIAKNKDYTDSIVKEEVKALGNEIKEEVKALSDVMKDNVTALDNQMKDLNTKTEQQEQRIAAMEHQLQQLMTEQTSTKSSLASAIVDVETRIEHRFEDLSSKIDRLISLQTSEDT